MVSPPCDKHISMSCTKRRAGLAAQFKSFRISWVPRELNVEADRLVNDALGAPD